MQGLSHPPDEQTSSAIAIKTFSFPRAHGSRKQNLIPNANLREKNVLQKGKGSREILETQ